MPNSRKVRPAPKPLRASRRRGKQSAAETGAAESPDDRPRDTISAEAPRVDSLGALHHDAIAKPGVREVLINSDFRGLIDPRTRKATNDRSTLDQALAQTLAALDDPAVRFALVVDYLQCQVRAQEAAKVAPFVPWDAPRDRTTSVGIDARDSGSPHYRAWLTATLADLADHFRKAMTSETDKVAAAGHLAIARLLRSVAIAFHRGNTEELKALAEPARVQLQRLLTEDVVVTLPARAAPTWRSCPAVQVGLPRGSVLVIPGADVVEPTRSTPASLFCLSLGYRLKHGYMEWERQAILAQMPRAVPRAAGPISDEEIALAAWSELRTPRFYSVAKDLRVQLPAEPGTELLKKMTTAIGDARTRAEAAGVDAEDTAERISRAILRALGYPGAKARSLLDPLRKKPPRE